MSTGARFSEDNMKVFLKTFLFFVVWCFCLTACGSDSKSSSVPENEDSAEQDSLRVSDRDSSGVSDVDVKASDAPVIVSKIEDYRTGDSIGIVQIGMYIWMTDNVTRRGVGTSSICYGEEDENCATYGRLFELPSANSACPSGFDLPSKRDWSWLGDYSLMYPEAVSTMQFTYGGYCIDRADSLDCRGLNSQGKYLASDGVAVLSPKSPLPTFENTLKLGYYQLRCMTYTYIVATKKELPLCDSTSKNRLEPFYVVSEKSNYRCLGTRWEDDFSDDCDHVITGTAVTINDTMYICKYDGWKVANIYDARETCTEENDSTTFLFNGERYACEDGGWRLFTDLEEKFGYCRGDLLGTFDTLRVRSDSVIKRVEYICDTSGWRRSVMTDHVGFCDSTKLYKKVKFQDTAYVCRNDEWQKLTELEKELGVCTPKKQDVIDTTEEGRGYICDNTYWRLVELEDYIGKCDSTKLEKIAKSGNYSYYCTTSGWHQMSNLELDLGMCTDKNDKSVKKAKDGTYYACKYSRWETAYITDVFGYCDSTCQYKEIVFNNNKYYCLGKSWTTKTRQDSAMGFCKTDMFNKVDSIVVDKNTEYYRCTGSEWVRLNNNEVRFGICSSTNAGEVKRVTDTAYVCSNGRWTDGGADSYLGSCKWSNTGEAKTYRRKQYVCHDPYWTEMTALEKNLGTCKESNCGTAVKDGSSYYVCNCKKLKWETSSATDWELGNCPADTVFYKQLKPTWYYKCINARWQAVTDPFEIYGQCGLGNNVEPRTVVLRDQEFACDKNNLKWNDWVALESIDSVKGYCTKAMRYDTLFYDGTYYMCDSTTASITTPNYRKYYWKEVTIREYMRDCNASSEGKVMFNGFNNSRCSNGKWTGITTETMTDSRDGRKYRVFTAGGVTMMVENLSYATADSSWCIGNSGSCSNGRLYAWSSAKKACPSGWRLPGRGEWSDINDVLKAVGNDYSYYGEGWDKDKGEDLYGLNITPTGFYEFYMQNGADPMTTQAHTTSGAFYWIEDEEYMSFGMTLRPDSSAQYVNAKIIGLGVRCIKK